MTAVQENTTPTPGRAAWHAAMATRPAGAESANVITPHQFPPAAAALIAARMLNKHSPCEIAEAVEILIDVLDLVDGDPDLEEDNEDCCDAGDDTGGYHPADGCGDGLAGDPLDAEPDDVWGRDVL